VADEAHSCRLPDLNAIVYIGASREELASSSLFSRVDEATAVCVVAVGAPTARDGRVERGLIELWLRLVVPRERHDCYSVGGGLFNERPVAFNFYELEMR
jgi:hypothetical protein